MVHGDVTVKVLD